VDLPAGGRRSLRLDVRDDLVAAAGPWVVSRVLVGVAYAVARLAADEYDLDPPALADGLFAWDGRWYRVIAEVGYGRLPEEALRFFPLYPISSRLLGFVLAGRTWIALILLANVGALLAAVLIRRLTLELTGDPQTAARAAWLLLLSPASFVLVWAYSEAVFLVAATGALVAMHRRAWWWMGALGAAAALTRPVGVLLAAAAAVAVAGWDRRRGRPREAPTGSVAARAAAVVGPIAGLAMYLAWAQLAVGDWQAPIDTQTALRGDVAIPLVPVADGIRDLFDGRLSPLLHLATTVGFAALVVLVFLRLPLAHGVLAAATFLVSTSAERLTSLERYALGAVPIVVVAAMVVERPAVERAALPLTASAMVALAALAWLGAYTP
jgi:hypothetical protein